MTRHVVQDIECPTCTTLAGPCATTEPARVAWPVFVLEGPASMSKLVRVARALKVLHGGDLRHKHLLTSDSEVHAWYTAGPDCGCMDCIEYTRRLIEGPHGA